MHVAHCKQSCDYTIGRADSHVPYVNAFPVCNHMIDCSVQCTIGTRNPKTTVKGLADFGDCLCNQICLVISRNITLKST